MALNEGKKFEQDFEKSIPEDMYYKREKDDTAGFRGVHNSHDYTLYRFPNLCLMELKSVKGKSIPFSNITNNQLEGLYNEGFKRGIIAGFLFNFRAVGQTYFVEVGKVWDYIKTAERKSIPVVWCEENGILLRGKKKRTRWRYDVDDLISKLRRGLDGERH